MKAHLDLLFSGAVWTLFLVGFDPGKYGSMSTLYLVTLVTTAGAAAIRPGLLRPLAPAIAGFVIYAVRVGLQTPAGGEAKEAQAFMFTGALPVVPFALVVALVVSGLGTLARRMLAGKKAGG